MTDERPTGRRRRRLGGASTTSGGLNPQREIDEEGLDEDLNDAVQAQATAPVAELSEADRPANRGGRAQDFTPRGRMDTVRGRASQYEREYRLKLLHRLLMRNIPLDEIATELEVSVATVIRDRKELYRRIKEAAAKLDINLMIGDSMGFYNEVSAMALRAASGAKTPMNLKLAAMRTAVAAKNDMHKFLTHAGVYEVLRYKKRKQMGSEDIQRLVNMTEELLKDESEQQAPSPLAQIPESALFDSAVLNEQEEEVVLI